MKRTALLASQGLLAALLLAGCSRPAPVAMAPPVAPPAPAPVAEGSAGVFDWKDVPKGQKVPVRRAVFDQGGYQIYAASGETIVVPFANQNMYVLKFGRSSGGGMEFVNEGDAPVLYVPNGGFLENAAAQGARWYPFPKDHVYERPMYVGIAPSWPEFVGMGWYPGMAFYGGYWGYRPWVPGLMYAPMVGLNINIGGRSYDRWDGYRDYYRSRPDGRVAWNSRPAFNYNRVGRASGSSSFGRTAAGSSGSFGAAGRRSGGFGTSSNFGGGRSTFGQSSGTRSTFGQSSGTRSTFGQPSGSRSTFGQSSGSRSSFGSGSSGFASGSNRSTGSFGSSSSGFGSSSSSRSTFGSSRSTFGGGGRSTFGGGGRSSFGGGRRR